MEKLFSHVVIIMAAVLSLTSCLGDNNDTDTTYYTDTAISSFTLGTLNLINHTTAHDGVTDSTYTTTFSASTYAFDIDQFAQTINNTDSLPKGTDLEHVLATINTTNSGTALLVLKSKDDKDSLAYYSSSDSIDFSNPVRVRVYNMMGSAYREYTIKVNAHKESENEFSWKTAPIDGYAGLDNRQFVSSEDKLFLTGLYNGTTSVFSNEVTSWKKTDKSIAKDANVIGSSKKYRYGIIDGKLMRANINGGEWTEEALDDDASLLPREGASFIAAPMVSDPSYYNLLIMGNCNGKTVMWSKVEDDGDKTQKWTYYNEDEYLQKKKLPYLENMKAVLYGDSIIATGGDFSQVYTSPDWGLTWTKSTLLKLPTDFGSQAAKFDMAVDKDNFLYISRDGSSTVWYGRLSQLGWKEDQKIFTKSAARRK